MTRDELEALAVQRLEDFQADLERPKTGVAFGDCVRLTFDVVFENLDAIREVRA